MIITQEKKGNIVYRNLVVEDKEKLIEFRDSLLDVNKDSYDINIMRNLAKLNSSVKSGYFKEGDKLVYQRIKETSLEDGITIYDRKEYQSKCLNSIQLFTSLLGYLDLKKYDSTTQKMITEGLIKWIPFNEELWNTYTRNIIQSVYSQIDAGNIKNISELNQNLDLMAFRWAVLDEGLISCDAIKNDSSNMKGDISDLQQIFINQAILLGDNHLFENRLAKKYAKCKTK